jgi:hypothetical protein
MLIVLLFSACSGDSESSETKQPTVISVYVFSPNNPIITRADVGPVAPIENPENENEGKITKLQIWVFNHDTGEKIAYYSPESVANLNGTSATGATYQLSVSEEFAQASTKPQVDVYVIANVTQDNCGMSFVEGTPRETLEAALIQGNYFGLTNLTDRVPADGLPMSGVQRDVTVSGSSPVYRLPENVVLTRAVSKIRFVFCREASEGNSADNKKVQIQSVILNKWMIPVKESLFLGAASNVYETVNDDSKEFVDEVLADIPTSENPLQYVYQSQSAQEYENLIATGVAAEELKQLGPYYLRESDKLLKGTITYQKEGEEAKTTEYKMAAAGDFSRNHTWIVYAYYSKSGLVAVTVVVKNWDDPTEKSHEVYNW